MNILRHTRNRKYRLYNARKQFRTLLAESIINYLKIIMESENRFTSLINYLDNYKTEDNEYKWNIEARCK